MSSEVGRELKVSELKLRSVVWLREFSDRRLPMATLWVTEVAADYVEFYSGVSRVTFRAARCGPALESITDDTGAAMAVYEYLGEI